MIAISQANLEYINRQQKKPVSNVANPASAKRVVSAQDEIDLSKNKATQEKSKKDYKKIIFAAIGLLGVVVITLYALSRNKKSLPVSSFGSIEEFRRSGYYFEKGIAKTKDKENFTGVINCNNKNGRYVLDYVDGKLIKSTKNTGGPFGKPQLTKEYKYNDGKLSEVSIKEHAQDSYEVIRRIFTDSYTQQFAIPTRTAEGLRRAKMTDEDILKESKRILRDIFIQEGLDLRLMPDMEVKVLDGAYGDYNETLNKIRINPVLYRKGTEELETTVAHEVYHAKRTFLKNRLPLDVVKSELKKELLRRINGFEPEVTFHTSVVKVPRMSKKMQKEFSEFAASNLYTTDVFFKASLKELCKTTEGPNIFLREKRILKKIEKLIDDNPDFIKQFSSREQAIKSLIDYSYSHTYRYNCFIDWTDSSLVSFLPPLTEKEQEQAIHALKEKISEQEALRETRDTLRYGVYFCNEEAQAEFFGSQYAIKKLREKRANLARTSAKAAAFQENYEYATARKVNAMKCRAKGELWYQKYIQHINNPDDIELAEAVRAEKKDLDKMLYRRMRLVPNGTVYRSRPRKSAK